MVPRTKQLLNNIIRELHGRPVPIQPLKRSHLARLWDQVVRDLGRCEAKNVDLNNVYWTTARDLPAEFPIIIAIQEGP